MDPLATQRLEQMGRRGRRAVRALLLLTPLAIASAWMARGPLGLVRVPPGVAVDASILAFPRSLPLVALGLLEPAAWVVGLTFLERLFGLYARGIVFSARNVALIRRTGWLLVALDAIRLLVSIATGPVLHLLGAAGSHLWFDLQISLAIVGAFVVLVAHVMDAGRELHETDQLTI
jgi:hypothetical protein